MYKEQMRKNALTTPTYYTYRSNTLISRTLVSYVYVLAHKHIQHSTEYFEGN